MRSNLPIILLPGMGADERVFAKQMESIPEIVVPEWIEPFENESLGDYARCWAIKIDPGEKCYIGGASFGGFVAVEMVRYLNVKGCFLIGSVRGPDELPVRIKTLRKLNGATNVLPFEVLKLFSRISLLSSGSFSTEHLKELLKQVVESDAAFLQWACQAVLQWEGSVDTGSVPIYQIHGQKDFVLPVKNTKPDVILKGAGHAISMSHADEVTEFIEDESGFRG